MMYLSTLALALSAPAAMDEANIGDQHDAKPMAQEAADNKAKADNDRAATNTAMSKKRAALAQLEKQLDASPNDPALLINIGITYAQMGLDEKARTAFEDALDCPKPQELVTADGRTMDSRRLARKAIEMLNRGEFSPT